MLWKIQGIKSAPNCHNLTHHRFVDDTILVGKAGLIEAKEFKNILDSYDKASNQKINYEKTNIFFFNTPVDRSESIARVFQYQISTFPAIYLGMPLFFGRIQKELWNGVMKRFDNKLSRWKGALLIMARKI